MEPGKLIGKGMTAEVYLCENNKVLKLFFKKFGRDRVTYEADIGFKIHQTGVPSPAVYGVVEVDDRHGIVFEHIYGKTILKQIEHQSWLISYFSKQMAAIHFDIHSFTEGNLPSQKKLLADAINLSSDINVTNKNRILSYLQSLPEGNSVCHGDLHFDNIIVSDGRLIPIDWKNACKGNPMGDVARTCMTIRSPTLPFGRLELYVMPYLYGKFFTYKEYLNEYMSLAKVNFESIDEWTLPVAAARLSEKIPGEKEWLMDIVQDYLDKL